VVTLKADKEFLLGDRVVKKVIKNACMEYFMPLIVLWRYLTAPDDAKTISIEHPRQHE
jgi:hypothetical protein